MSKPTSLSQFIPPSSSISIVAPSEKDAKEESNNKSPPKSQSGKRLCRNIIIHGFCKYQEKGCDFNHETLLQNNRVDNSPEKKHTTIGSTVSADSINAPVFIPKLNSQENHSHVSTPMDSSYRYSMHSNTIDNTYSSYGIPSNMNGYNTGYSSPIVPMLNNNTSDPYYYINHPNQQPLQYHKYPPSLPHIANLLPHQRVTQSFAIPDNLAEQLLKRSETSILSSSVKSVGLPEEVHVYHSLYLVDEKPTDILGHSAWSYRAVSRLDGKQYTMVRIEGFRLVNEKAMGIIKKWRNIRHSNIVCIHEAFTSRAFGDSSLIFIYDYHPCSVSLYDAYFTPQAQVLLQARFQATGGNSLPVPETTLWSFITQIASALKTIHENGLSSRTIEPNKIIMTSKNRLRLNCSALLDVLQYDGTQIASVYQQEDLMAFGRLIVDLACNSLQSSIKLPPFEYITRFYSADLKNTVLYLLGKPSPTKSIDEVIRLIGPRILHEINSSQYYTDALESNLSKELENSRLVRLLSKFGFINERPEFEQDPRWSETGDRYMIKLFRDYVFHQINEIGQPVTDMAHVISCLNKLDAGTDETISLTSRDQQTSIIVSYKELKTCIQSAFNDIYEKSNHGNHNK
ncbi:hypothetical protein BDB01DRAFT_756459 [Pilobolus umbonatus]|nr:hypothetical protein BDB01DRAFT_756459 [Pilobolus umbonatus]